MNQNLRFDKNNTERHEFPANPEFALIDPSTALQKEVAFHSFVPFAPSHTISRPLASI